MASLICSDGRLRHLVPSLYHLRGACGSLPTGWRRSPPPPPSKPRSARLPTAALQLASPSTPAMARCAEPRSHAYAGTSGDIVMGFASPETVGAHVFACARRRTPRSRTISHWNYSLAVPHSLRMTGSCSDAIICTRSRGGHRPSTRAPWRSTTPGAGCAQTARPHRSRNNRNRELLGGHIDWPANHVFDGHRWDRLAVVRRVWMPARLTFATHAIW